MRHEIDPCLLGIEQFLLRTCSILASIEQMILVNGSIQDGHCSCPTWIDPLPVEHCSMQTCIEQFPDENCPIPIEICSMIDEIDQGPEIFVSCRASAGPVLAGDASFRAGNVSRRTGESTSPALPGRFLDRERFSSGP